MEEKLLEMRFRFITYLFSSDTKQGTINKLQSKTHYINFFKRMFKGNKLDA